MNRPNILLITTDQQRFDTISALGNSVIYTPHLNWLVREGISFVNCYSACPLCMPARATIMTGLEAHNHGQVGNDNSVLPMKDHMTFPKLLAQNGYQTRAEGKLHFNPMRTYYGIEHADLPMDYFNEMRKYGKASTRLHGVGENEMEPVVNMMEEKDTLTHWIVEKSMDFLENRDPTRPFFLWTSFPKPHSPLDPLLSYWQLYQNARVERPVTGEWSKDREKMSYNYLEPTIRLNRIFDLSEDQILEIKKAYYACITQIDYNLGLLFAKMRELNLLENTWILFTSDHGEMLGDHHMGAKSIHFEGSAHVPMLLKPPAAFGASDFRYKGRVCEKPVTLADVMPTILSLCGVDYSGPSDGENLLCYLDSREEKTIYGDCEDKYLCIIKNGWKYMWSWYGGEEMLFHLTNDPKETMNLIDEEEGNERGCELRTLLMNYMKEHRPGLFEHGVLKKGEPILDLNSVSSFPGLNTTVFPRDSFH